MLSGSSALALPQRQLDEFRFRCSLYQRMPRSLESSAQLTELDLNNLGLEWVQLGEFVSLEILLLRGNALKSLEQSGIHTLLKLKALDLRYNKLKSFEEVTSLAVMLPLLQAIGISGNPFAHVQHLRATFLEQYPPITKVDCPLYRIDDEDISVDELARVMRFDGKADAERFRFSATVQRLLRANALVKTAPVDLSTVEELNLRKCGLEWVDFKEFKSLKRLVLSHNFLTSAALEGENMCLRFFFRFPVLAVTVYAAH